MIWVGWNNGKHHLTGAGYGLKVNAADRDQYFSRVWQTVLIELPRPGGSLIAEVNVAKKSFWGGQCRELISKDIGLWLLDRGHAPWPAGAPPKFEVMRIGERQFRVKGMLPPNRECGLVRRVLGSSAFVPISAEDYVEISAAKAGLVGTLNVEEKFDLVVENYLELETCFLDSTARHMVLCNQDYPGSRAQLNLFNRRLANLLSACRSYIDYSKQHIHAMLPAENDAKERIELEFSSHYDNCLGYRVMEALRNFVQHRGLPIHGVTNQGRWLGEGDGSQLMYGLSVYSETRYLREDGGFKNEVLEELENRGGKVDLKPLVRQYVAALGDVHKLLRTMTGPALEAWDAVILGAIAQFKSAYPNDRSVVGLSAVLKNEQTWDRPVDIFRELIDYRRALQRKNGELVNLEKRFVTGQVVKG